METGMTNYNKDKFEGVTEAWNIVQSEFKCCGVKNYVDWKDTEFGEVPDFCCIENTEGCAKGTVDLPEDQAKNKIYTNGCLTKFETAITDNVGLAAGIGAGLVILLFIGMLMSCCVAKNLREKQMYV